ncbi:aldo/keto reductase [Marinovum sp. 2_MG-2023]|uniref:aldo/keto reductase n=1 Tax=unclassified Marinovum TaxID=2647166 RepID=UPI0026E3FCD9|nr:MULTISPECIES: aldo/keto reductase [unclassified Marinovum]MDO6732558.1 aldo/keto reductase [Marinovum sp. 2_MG-2023]MDO6781810.1 aldo/keto reductase [Marinovum sp. 1_MG-2023]
MLTENHRLSFGCGGLGGLYRPVSDGEAQDVLAAAWDHGIRYFDTAPHYGHGASEHRLGRFLRERQDWVISTKVGRILSPDSNPPEVVNGFHSALPFRQRFDFSYDGIMRSVEDSYQRLGVNRIDILYVHDIGDPGAGTDTAEHRAQLLDSGVRALEELKAAGVVSSVGLGVNTVEICEELIGKMPIDLILLAGRYTLLDRSAQARLFPLAELHGIRFVMGGVFNSGILATGPVEGAHYNYAPAPQDIRERTARLEAICQQHDTPLAAAALQFPARHPLVASTLIGTGKVSSLARNVAQFGADLPDALWSELEIAP